MKRQRAMASRLVGPILVLIGMISWVAPAEHASSGPAPSGSAEFSQMTQLNVNEWSSNGPILAINSLAIDPVNSNIIYAAAKRGVFKSSDAGTTWKNMGLNDFFVSAVAIDFVSPSILYAGTSCWCPVHAPGDRFLFKSTDGGASWSNSNSPIDFDISLLVMDPASPDVLYTGSAAHYDNGDGTWPAKSTDGGATWKYLATGSVGLAYYGWAIDPTNPDILYAPGSFFSDATFDGRFFKSTDGGENWSTTGLSDTSVSAVAIDPLNPATLYAGSFDYGPNRGMFKSTDGGATWIEINNGLENLIGSGSGIVALVVNPSNPNTLYIGTSDNLTSGKGVFRSVDGGSSWEPFNYGLTNMDILAFAIHPSDPNSLYAATAGGVFKIVDNVPSPFAIPKILSASVAGKKLFVFGENFYPGAVILINGEEQITRNNAEDPQSALIGKNAGKKIKPGDKLQVRNPSGKLSEEFTFIGT